MSAKKVSKTILPNDFERMIPEYHKNTIIYGEHIVRYETAAKLLKGKIVLDIASGSGYGTKLLATDAKKVIGVDISEDSVLYARENYQGNNIEYLVGDGERIPLKDASVDVVVSFETIEHIRDYKTFLKEVKRVLKKDGLFIVSTPNDLEFAEGNHFHLHEFKYGELRGLLEQYFKNTKSYFQGTWIYSALLSETNISKEKRLSLDTLNVAPLTPEKYLYFFLLCSDRELTEMVTESGAIAEHWSERENQEKQKLTEQHVSNISDMLAAAEKHSSKLASIIQDKDTHIKNIETELGTIKNSSIWKAMQKARRVVKKD